ncbi:hypothetical protein KY285_036934 [Solanum tuberosum]|uniref:Jacalin-type lectin domain-containing protein n=1 Tax=Solanum tuberosum TaxID=4113 RepID=Q3HVK8_SOLTU|nr:unknown [Solanum tuberosum]KAH0640348.1 hypothetical protein KY285_036934 [Solanum tuberosum]
MEMIKVGPVGSRGGSIWEENGRGEVAGIFVSYTEDTIQSLQFLFYEDGNFVQSNKHGSQYCSNFSAVLLDYPSEFLTSLSGSYVNNGGLEAIKFNTNKGSYGPFGQPTSDAYHFNFQLGNHSLFGGFHGTTSSYAVDSIGIYVKPVVSSMINLKDLRVKDEK